MLIIFLLACLGLKGPSCFTVSCCYAYSFIICQQINYLFSSPHEGFKIAAMKILGIYYFYNKLDCHLWYFTDPSSYRHHAGNEMRGLLSMEHYAEALRLINLRG